MRGERKELHGYTGCNGRPQGFNPRDHRDQGVSGTGEFDVYVVAVAAVLTASLILDGFDATEGWMFVTYLSIGYMVSRGLAKAGSRDTYGTDDRRGPADRDLIDR